VSTFQVERVRRPFDLTLLGFGGGRYLGLADKDEDADSGDGNDGADQDDLDEGDAALAAHTREEHGQDSGYTSFQGMERTGSVESGGVTRRDVVRTKKEAEPLGGAPLCRRISLEVTAGADTDQASRR